MSFSDTGVYKINAPPAEARMCAKAAVAQRSASECGAGKVGGEAVREEVGKWAGGCHPRAQCRAPKTCFFVLAVVFPLCVVAHSHCFCLGFELFWSDACAGFVLY